MLLLLFPLISFSQVEGQDFCKGYSLGEYFPLDIKNKKIIWGKMHYFETYAGTQKIDGKDYSVFKQVWSSNDNDTLYLKKDATAIVQYDQRSKAVNTRFDSNFKEGSTWHNSDKSAQYTLLSYSDKLKTPYCNYIGLLSIKAEYKNVTYTFFYLKGYGYIGATKDNKLISYVTPEW